MEENNNDFSSNQSNQKTASEIWKELWSKKYFRIGTIAAAVILFAVIIIVIVVSTLPTKSNYFIGDEISNSKSTFCVESAYNTKKVGQFGSISNGYFFVIRVSYTNNTSRAVTVETSDFVLHNGSKKYKVSSETIIASNPLIVYEEVGAGICKTFEIVFEAPTDLDSGNYVLSFSSPTGKFNVNLAERESDDDDDKVIGYH